MPSRPPNIPPTPAHPQPPLLIYPPPPGPLVSMRHLKSEAESIAKGKECGVKFKDSRVRFERGDVVECFVVHQDEQECDWRPRGF